MASQFSSFTWVKKDILSEVPPSEVYSPFSHESSASIVEDNEFVITIKSKYTDVEGVIKITEAILEMIERTKDD